MLFFPEVKKGNFIYLDMYLVSGGVSMQPIMPGGSRDVWAWLESRFSPWTESWAILAHITLIRQ